MVVWALLAVMAAEDLGGSPFGAPPGSAARLLTPPRPAPPPEPAPPKVEARQPDRSDDHRYLLKPVRGGGFEYEDSRFKAKIAEDGVVTFDDKRVTTKFSFLPFLPNEHPPGTPTLEGALRDLAGRGPRRRAQPQPAEPPRASPPVDVNMPLSRRDATRENPAYPVTFVPAATASGTFDLTDEYYRLMGKDPYSYEKARFLAATFDFRLRMAVREHARRLLRAQRELPAHLGAIWRDRQRPAIERRRLICGLWAELIDAPAGHEAAATIERFISDTLKPDTPDAYSDAEIDACNAASARAGGRAHFAPYGSPPAP